MSSTGERTESVKNITINRSVLGDAFRRLQPGVDAAFAVLADIERADIENRDDEALAPLRWVLQRLGEDIDNSADCWGGHWHAPLEKESPAVAAAGPDAINERGAK